MDKIEFFMLPVGTNIQVDVSFDGERHDVFTAEIVQKDEDEIQTFVNDVESSNTALPVKPGDPYYIRWGTYDSYVKSATVVDEPI